MQYAMCIYVFFSQQRISVVQNSVEERRMSGVSKKNQAEDGEVTQIEEKVQRS